MTQRRGRPLSPKAQAVMAAITTLVKQGQQATPRAIAQQALLSYADAYISIGNLKTAGRIVCSGMVRTPHAKRPVATYAIAAPKAAVARGPAPIQTLATALCAWRKPA